MKFFIVDDDYEIIDLMTVLLEGAGHEVQSCVAGEEALADISAIKPDCVITDLMMASLDGLALCDEIRANPGLADVKIVMVSARDADHWRQQALQHGAQGYLTKPIDMATFTGSVVQLIEAA